MNLTLLIWNDILVIHKKRTECVLPFMISTEITTLKWTCPDLKTFCIPRIPSAKLYSSILTLTQSPILEKIICILNDLFWPNFRKPLGWMTRLKAKFIIYTSKTKNRVRHVTKPPSAKPARISGLNSRGEGWWDVERQAGGGEGVASSRSQHAQEVRKTCTTHISSITFHYTAQ